MKHLRTLSLLAGSLVLLAACSSTPPLALAPPKVQPAPAAPGPSQSGAVASARSETMALAPHLDSKHPLSTQRSIYFDYDFFSVKPEFTAMVAMHGKYLSANPQVRIRVQGHADERGSSEYNLALGQKRADAVVRALQVYGVKQAQMEAISFGSEKPKALGNDESAFAQNRRVDLEYPDQ